MAFLETLVSRWWVRVLVVWAATRVIGTILFLWLSSIQGQSYWNAAHPGYFDLINIWDAEWYERIYDFGFSGAPGYSKELPVNEYDDVQQNAWAFLPLFPYAVRFVTVLTGLEFKFAAPLLSTLASFVLALLIYKIFRTKFDDKVALWGLFLFGTSVSATVLQTGYAESLGLVFQAAALYLILQRKYWLSLPFLLLLSLTRPGMIAFALMLGGIWLVRFYRHVKKQENFGWLERISLAATSVISAALGYLWALIAGIYTGEPDAYILSEMSWRSWLGTGYQFVPVQPWFFAGEQFFGQLGWLAVIGIWALMFGSLFTQPVKALGYELRLWVASYFVYIVLVFYPQSSTWRIMLPVFPLAAALAFATRKASLSTKVLLAIAFVITQLVWLSITWYYASPDYTPP